MPAWCSLKNSNPEIPHCRVTRALDKPFLLICHSHAADWDNIFHLVGQGNHVLTIPRSFPSRRTEWSLSTPYAFLFFLAYLKGKELAAVKKIICICEKRLIPSSITIQIGARGVIFIFCIAVQAAWFFKNTFASGKIFPKTTLLFWKICCHIFLHGVHTK